MLATEKELSPVTAAVVKLQELAHRMTETRFQFARGDVQNVTEIMQCIQDLEAERQKAHQILEEESIKANVLRHRLREYPRDTNEELEEAVRAARELNRDVINNLRKQIRSVNESIVSMSEQTKSLEAENDALLLEKEKLQSTHDKCIAKLNEVLSDKALRAIKLNETRDRLKQANTRIVQLEEDTQQLHDDLIQERLDSRDELKRLKKEQSIRADKRDIQKVHNEQKKRELLILEEKVKDSDQFLTELKDSIAAYESSIQRYISESNKAGKELDDRLLYGTELQRQTTDWQEKIKLLHADYEHSNRTLKEKIAAATDENNQLLSKMHDLKLKKHKVDDELTEALAQREQIEAKVKALNEKLVEVRRELNKKNEELGALKLAQMEAEAALAELADQHNMAVMHLNRTVDELRDQVYAEKREREELQARKDQLQKDMDEFQAFSNKFMKDVNAKINHAKKLYEQYDKEIGRLQAAIKKHEQDIIDTREGIEEWKLRHIDTEQILNQRIVEMEAQLAELLKDNEEKQAKHDAKKTEVDALDRECDAAGKTFEDNKRIFIRQKNKKQGLEDQCAALTREIEKIAAPNAKLVEELTKNKQKTIEALKQHAQEKTELEMQIYAITAKMKTVLEENSRFEGRNKMMDESLKQLRDQYDSLIRFKAQLRRDLLEHKHILTKAWGDDKQLNDAFLEAEQVLMKDFDEILGISFQREKRLHRITDRLRRELAKFAVDFRIAVEDTSKPEDRSPSNSANSSRADSLIDSQLPNQQIAAMINALASGTDGTFNDGSRLMAISEETETITATNPLTSSEMTNLTTTTITTTTTKSLQPANQIGPTSHTDLQDLPEQPETERV